VKQRADFSQSGQWDVETESSEGNRQKHIFDAVMVCIGHHCQPNLPLHDFPGTAGRQSYTTRFNDLYFILYTLFIQAENQSTKC